jgi:hypothetical protein
VRAPVTPPNALAHRTLWGSPSLGLDRFGSEAVFSHSHVRLSPMNRPFSAEAALRKCADSVAKLFCAIGRARLIRQQPPCGNEDSRPSRLRNKDCATDPSCRLLQQYLPEGDVAAPTTKPYSCVRLLHGKPNAQSRTPGRGVAEPATLVCGIRCSAGGTPPSVRMTRYFAPSFRCWRTSR